MIVSKVHYILNHKRNRLRQILASLLNFTFLKIEILFFLRVNIFKRTKNGKIKTEKWRFLFWIVLWITWNWSQTSCFRFLYRKNFLNFKNQTILHLKKNVYILYIFNFWDLFSSFNTCLFCTTFRYLTVFQNFKSLYYQKSQKKTTATIFSKFGQLNIWVFSIFIFSKSKISQNFMTFFSVLLLRRSVKN